MVEVDLHSFQSSRPFLWKQSMCGTGMRLMKTDVHIFLEADLQDFGSKSPCI
jgi:hypothetical protein